MSERKLCTIGVDFGSLSARVVVVDTDSGAILGEAAAEYPHGILSGNLPDGTPLEPDCFLQDPEDYTDVLARIVPQAVKAAGDVDIIGMATSKKVWYKLALSWGVQPVLCEHFESTDVLFYNALHAAKKAMHLHKGDNIVMTAGNTNGASGNTNLIKVETI